MTLVANGDNILTLQLVEFDARSTGSNLNRKLTDGHLEHISVTGLFVQLDNVLGIVISEEVGSLNRLLKDVSDSFINIDYLYVCYIRNVKNPVAILHVQESAEVQECLKGKGYTALDNSSL